MLRFLALVVIASTLAVVSTAGATQAAARCRGTQLAGSYSVVPGSAGAGSITYALALKNTSATTCTVTGLPEGQLLGQKRQPLPTHIRAAFPGALSAVLVTLAPGRSTRAIARFSPDVPGQGEQTIGRCEPVAWWLRVVGQGGGSTTVRISPPTSVCEHGRMFFSAYTRS